MNDEKIRCYVCASADYAASACVHIDFVFTPKESVDLNKVGGLIRTLADDMHISYDYIPEVFYDNSTLQLYFEDKTPWFELQFFKDCVGNYITDNYL